MNVRIDDPDLQRMESDPSYVAREFSQDIVRSFRRKMQVIRAAESELDLKGMNSLYFKRLSGARSHQWSIRLNLQWRLILEFEESAGGKVVVVIRIEDYH